MEHDEAVVAFRAEVAKLFASLDPRPTDERIAQEVDRLLPLDGGDVTDGPAEHPVDRSKPS